jgi:hypothetical protein
MLPPWAWWPLVFLVTLKLGVHLYAIQGYGIFRDELYYLACAGHLALGYVDHPSLSILVLWGVKNLLGTSVIAVRILPALLGAATLVLIAGMAREMGGGRIAQMVAAVAGLIVPYYLAIHHIYSMNAISLFLWAATALLITRLIRTEAPRLWLWIGCVMALGLANKIDVLWLGAGLGAGLLLSPQRRWIATRWPWLAAGLSLLGLLPYLIWQMGHDWATLEFMGNATSQKMAAVSVVEFFQGQILTMHPLTLPLWLGGLLYLLLSRRGHQYRLLAWMYLAIALILAASGTSRSGYLGPAYTWLFAAGAVGLEAILERRRRQWIAWPVMGLMLAGGAATAPLALPVLSVERYVPYARSLGVGPSTEERKEVGVLPQFYADMHGWESITQTVVDVVESLPPDERDRVRVFAPNYGVAAALDYYGRKHGLAPSLSGHNNYWYWGPGDLDGKILLSIGGQRRTFEGLCGSVEQVATIDCGLCMPYENGRPLWLCRELQIDAAEIWPRTRHFD